MVQYFRSYQRDKRRLEEEKREQEKRQREEEFDLSEG